VLGLCVLVAVRLARRERRGQTQVAPPLARRADPDAYRILVVADGPCSARDRRADRTARGRPGGTRIRCRSGPRLATRLADRRRIRLPDAQHHLEATLAAVEPITASRDGKVGAADPLQDESGSENWLETDLVDNCRERYQTNFGKQGGDRASPDEGDALLAGSGLRWLVRLKQRGVVGLRGVRR
jgi:hypothetical protein